MTDSKLLNVDEVAELIGVLRSYAYRVIRRLNKELTASGHYVVPGRINRHIWSRSTSASSEGAPKTKGAV